MKNICESHHNFAFRLKYLEVYQLVELKDYNMFMGTNMPGVIPRNQSITKLLFKMCVCSVAQLFVMSWTVAAKLICPWDSLGKNTGVGSHALLQGIFLTRRSNPRLLSLPALAGGFFTTSATWDACSRPSGQVQFEERWRILFDQIRSIRHNNSFRQLEIGLYIKLKY